MFPERPGNAIWGVDVFRRLTEAPCSDGVAAHLAFEAAGFLLSAAGDDRLFENFIQYDPS